VTAAGRIEAAFRGSGLVLGVDAGGTSTRAVLLRDGIPERRLSSGPFNYLLDRHGTKRMASLIREAGAAAAGIGIPGLAREAGADLALARAISAASGAHVVVASDATVAWLGAFLGGPGIVVIAGTGSVAVGGPQTATARAGGHGFLIGDEGGGYWIGRQALRAALAGTEGTGPPTRLAEAIPAATGCALDELVVRVHREPRDRAILASLAPVVARCASGEGRSSGADRHGGAALTGSRDAGDPVAREILRAAAAELAELASAVQRRLGTPAGSPQALGAGPPGAEAGRLPVAGVGGVFAIPELWAEFTRLTGARPPLAEPAIGAALLLGRG